MVAVGATAACGLNAAGQLSVDASGGPPAKRGGDSGSLSTSPGDASRDATTVQEASAAVDAGAPPADAASDTSVDAEGLADSSGTSDASVAETGPADAHHADAAGADAGHPDAASSHDAASADAGVDSSPPPGGCILAYSCGSSRCGCNQRCDEGTTCGACMPHFGTCTLSVEACDTDFSSPFNCGGCGNSCYISCPSFTPSCNLVGGAYTCGC